MADPSGTLAGPAVMPALIRADANRYVVPLMPFAVLGLRELLALIPRIVRRQP